MKTTPNWIRTIAMLAFAALAVGCASSSGKPNILDSGTDSKGTGGGSGGTGSGGASVDARPDGNAGADGGGDATDMGQPPAPVLAVSQVNVPVTAGSTVTIAGAVVGAPASTVFTIRNTGNAAMTVGGVTVAPTGVLSVTAQPDATVAAGSSTMFTVAFNPTAVGTSTATVSINNNASAGFSFTISATSTAAPQPAIVASGSAGDIASGGTLAFGSVEVGSPKDQTVTIRNTGTATLVLSGNPTVAGTNNTHFTLKTPPDSLSIAAGGMTTFVVTYSPAAKGDETGTITISNNTTDTPTFMVNLTGTGTITATGYTVTAANGASGIGMVGGTLQLTATIVPAGATDPGVTWSAGTPAVATVDGNGLVTAVAPGQTTITATATDGSGLKGTFVIPVAMVYFVQQIANAGTTVTSATLASGTFTVNSNFSASGNAFKFASPNYYGTVSNGFIAFPVQMTGDFSITANVTVTTENKGNNACGIGVGITTGFLGTDSYAYALMRNTTAAPLTSGVINGYYVSGTGATSAGSPSVNFTTGTPMQLTFSRTGSNLTYGGGPAGVAPTTNVAATSFFTNGTTVYGGGPVYPAISFNNVAATITNLVVKDSTGTTVFDSAAGGILVTYIPASLTLSASALAITKGASAPVTATAVAVGGTVSTVTATPANTSIVSATVANGTTNSIITLTGLAGGTTNVTVTNTSDPNPATNTKMIQVTVNDYSTTDNYGPLTTAYPAVAATNAYIDGELALTFDAAPTLNPGGSIKIYKTSDGTQVDSISFANESQTFVTGTSTATINVGSQLARVSGNTVFFTPHLGKLTYGSSYYVVIPTTSISGTLNGMPFVGFSNLNTVATWNFTTGAAPTLDATNITVDGAQTGTANFRTVQGALGALSGIAATTTFTINVAAGTYNELVHYTGPGLTQTININGPTGNNQGDTCVIQYTNGNGMNGTTQTRASVYFAGTNLVLQNVKLVNKAVRATLAQSEALYFASGTVAGVTGTLAVNNSSFISNQDTIQTAGRSWFYNSHVEGNVDFIWGTGDAALFENCTLRVINDGGASYSIFVARTGTTIGATASGTVGKGYVLWNSTVTLDAGTTVFFGRDAGTGAFYDQVALINVMFSSAANGAVAAGVLGAGLWNVTTPPLLLGTPGTPSIIGWKAAGCTGLMADTITTAANTSATIDSQATEYDTRDHILNRVVTVTAGAAAGYQPAPTTAGWNVPALATAFGAPAQP